ncbi:MAG: sensory histidine kinase AtoS [Methanocella sp. PtaU1.Bin125]|nr:MAG: sensory histidine kinase AtoS [Methanocella sp. PtaU1.Bin125]
MVITMADRQRIGHNSTGVEDSVLWSTDCLDVALIVTDGQEKITWTNRPFDELSGTPREDAIGRSRRDMLEPFARRFRDPDIFMKNILWLYDHPAEELRATWELAGGKGLVHLFSRPVRDPEGRIAGRVESYRKADARDLQGGLEQAALDALPVAIIVVNDALDIVRYNRSGRDFIGDVLGYDPREAHSLDVLGHDSPLTGTVIAALGHGRTEKRSGLELGGRYFDVIVTPMARGKQAHGAVVALIDAGEAREREAQCERLRRETEFYVDLMSHDIRNFNQVSMGYMEMLELSENLAEDQRAYLEKALSGVKGSNKLIDDIKRIRMIRETGGNNLVPMDLGKILAEDVQHIVRTYEGRRVVVNQNAGSGCMAMVNGLAHDVFRHIMENAIKFDEHPEKVIDIDVVDSQEGFWTVRIADHGPGMPDDRKKPVFERMSGGSTRGAGLGLSIVKLIVDRFGGRIWVEDRVPGDRSQGSVFVVQLRKA